MNQPPDTNVGAPREPFATSTSPWEMRDRHAEPDGPPDRLSILGISLDLVDAATTQAWLAAALADPWDGHCRHLVTLNPEYVMAARGDPAFAAAIAAADLIVADGIGVLLAGRALAGNQAEGLGRVTGVDLVEWLAAISGPSAAPMFLLGAAPGVAAEAAQALARRSPPAQIADTRDGSPAPADDAASLARIAGSAARVILVAYGAPAQVLWIARNRDALAGAGVRLAIGVGGAFDYLAGRTPRAPALVRRLGLEWLYRLTREPWRWRRQLALPHFALLSCLAWVWQRGNRSWRWARLKRTAARSRSAPSAPIARNDHEPVTSESEVCSPAPR